MCLLSPVDVKKFLFLNEKTTEKKSQTNSGADIHWLRCAYSYCASGTLIIL